jgi:hypothetical protein
MVEPGGVGGGEEEDLELGGPQPLPQRQPVRLPLGETLCVELEVAGLVAQHQIAHLLEDRVDGVDVQEPVVRRADDLGDDEGLNLELHAEGPPEQAEAGVRPVPGDQLPAEAGHQVLEQAGVHLLLDDEEGQCLDVIRIIGMGPARLVEQEGTFAALAELEVGEGPGQFRRRPGILGAGQIPARFGPVDPVVLEVPKPVSGVHAPMRTGRRGALARTGQISAEASRTLCNLHTDAGIGGSRRRPAGRYHDGP